MIQKTYALTQARKDLPQRHFHDHKTRGGKALLIAGSKGMWGAAVLAAKACARSGAGYVYLKTDSHKFPFQKNPDFLELRNISQVKEMSGVGIGPGFKSHRQILRWIKKLKALKIPVVLDAEALNALSQKKVMRLPKNWIMTPHEGELARLMKVSSAKIQKRRQYYVLAAQKKWGCVVLLKGHHTLIADGENLFQIQVGNASLAKAGTGDVLTGMITAFLSQQLKPVRAACLAAFIHGRISDRWLKGKKDVLSLTASDLINDLPHEIYQIRPKSQLKDF